MCMCCTCSSASSAPRVEACTITPLLSVAKAFITLERSDCTSSFTSSTSSFRRMHQEGASSSRVEKKVCCCYC